MTCDQLRELLAPMPGHVPVHVEVPADGSGGGGDTHYYYTLDCTLEAFPSQGRMVVISLNMDPR